MLPQIEEAESGLEVLCIASDNLGDFLRKVSIDIHRNLFNNKEREGGQEEEGRDGKGRRKAGRITVQGIITQNKFLCMPIDTFLKKSPRLSEAIHKTFKSDSASSICGNNDSDSKIYGSYHLQ